MNKTTLRSAVLGLSVLFFSFESLFAKSSEIPCDRLCLTDITEQYLEAMLRGSVHGLPLASNLRATSNVALWLYGISRT